MAPYEHAEVAISYRSRGMDTFYYQIPAHREIRDFELTVEVDRLPVSEINYPEGVLTATSVVPTADGRGSRLVWRFDRVVTVAGMGVALPQPEQPGADVLRVLLNSAYAITLLGCMVALTLLIRGEGVHFLEMALLSAVYCVQFLVMAAVSDYTLGFWGSWLLGAVLTGGLAFLLYRCLESRATRLLIYGLVAFFTLVYPLAGLLTETRHRNALDGLVQAGLIIYLFVLALVDRVNRQQRGGHVEEPAFVGGSGSSEVSELP